MIVYPNKGFEVRSDKPNENWTEIEDVFVVEDGSELAQKIMQYYPNYEFVLDGQGNLVDVIPTESPPIIEYDPIDSEKIAMAEAIIQHELEIQTLKAELAALKKGEE